MFTSCQNIIRKLWDAFAAVGRCQQLSPNRTARQLRAKLQTSTPTAITTPLTHPLPVLHPASLRVAPRVAPSPEGTMHEAVRVPLSCACSLQDATGAADSVNALLEFIPSLIPQKDVLRVFHPPSKHLVTLHTFPSVATLLKQAPFFDFTDCRNSAQTHHFTTNLPGMCQTLD